MSHDFFIPKHRWQLVDFFKRQRPGWNVSSWTKKKLLAVYFKLRTETR